MRGVLAALAAGIMALSCSSATPSASVPSDSPVPATTSAPSIPSPSPVSVAAALAPPSDVVVGFSSLRPGTYPVHVHSRCSGNQAFHIVIVESLRVNAMGTGSIEVPRGYLGRGLSLIVYSNSSLSGVLTTHPI
jgi:hypothetical protein